MKRLTLLCMVPLYATPLERLAAAVTVPAIVGAVACSIALVAVWRLGQPVAQLARRAKPRKLDSSSELKALDPNNQQKVEQLAVAASEIRNISNSLDLEDMETYVERRRQITTVLAAKNGWY
jgi:hypothetical protein